jgi:gas vesicle protein
VEGNTVAHERDESRPDQEAHSTGGQGRKFFLVGLLSAAAGAVTAMLLTPWRGSEARQKVKEGAQKAGVAAKEGAIKAGSAAKEGAAKAGKVVKEKAGEVARRARRTEAEKKDA